MNNPREHGTTIDSGFDLHSGGGCSVFLTALPLRCQLSHERDVTTLTLLLEFLGKAQILNLNFSRAKAISAWASNDLGLGHHCPDRR